jgi:hypothetical protein
LRGFSLFRIVNSTARVLSRAGSFPGNTSATHSPAFQPGTGVTLPCFGTKRERSVSFILWM